MQAVQSYGRAALVAVVTLYLAVPNAQASDLGKAALAAILAPLLRALNVDDTAFGLGANKK
ncbi:hypothetical protein UFOVP30_1 [uncultured Caudovirales phage]|uniref:Uncharacterized protein n=1 Tax=uncultured Caudovirales phage TaxID=2100421 RepID=A0A6J5KJK1_9CAUD|nr:hypothetical protein UFOVP30_1 [uncultured Caudovirales phage]